MTVEEDRILELTKIQDSMQQLILAQTETIKTQNQTIQNQNLQIQGMQSQLMTVIQMAQRASPSNLDQSNFPDNWEAPEILEEEDEVDRDPIEFPDIFTSEHTEQPDIIGDDNGNN